ncbi:hypothetical protein HNR61_000789 [Actinomadura namibiensis]|uniref:Uncharacterized protein n=1 Tax=Actinomadura namibiensis TaxID=182080 RepID=A0A7W3LJA3_ACTNM|nr:hypothetical protein [Actinomadura namibiensis]
MESRAAVWMLAQAVTEAILVAALRRRFPHHGIVCDPRGIWHAVRCVNKWTVVVHAHTPCELRDKLLGTEGHR